MAGPDRSLTRREILVSGALAAGYALAARPVAAAAIQTDGVGLAEGLAEIPASGAEIRAYYAYPAAAGAEGAGEAGVPGAPVRDGKPVPVVLVVHEIFGLHEYIRDVCRRLAHEGFFAVAPDLYQRQGDVSQLASVDEILANVVAKVPDAQVMADLDATLAWVKQGGAGDVSRVAITGFCWGGRIVWLYAAHNPELDAGAAWYGSLDGAPGETTPVHPLGFADRLHAPVIGLYGSADRGIPLEQVDAMRAKLAANGGSSEIVVFPGAPHGFHADYRDSYRALSAAEAWRRMLAWFRGHGLA